MAWFVGRSVVVIVLAFVLGLVVGWLWWRRRKVHFGESQTIARLTRTHQARTDQLSAALARKDGELRARDDEVARLRAEAEAAASASAASSTGTVGAATGVGVSSGSATWRGTTDVDDATDAAADAATPGRAPAQPAAPAAPTQPAGPAELVTEPSDPSPQTLAALATPVEEIRSEEHQTPVTPATPAASAEARPAVPVPQQVAGAGEDSSAVGEESVAEPIEEDDLERVEGIGPRIGAALRGAGIHTFRQLADADTTTLQGALEQAGLRFAPSLPTWSRQARFLAEGDEAGFVALTQQLVGGRDVSGAK